MLVPRGEAEALVELARALPADGVVPSLLLASGEPSAALRAPASLEIEPIEIVPLDGPERSGT